MMEPKKEKGQKGPTGQPSSRRGLGLGFGGLGVQGLGLKPKIWKPHSLNP